ncbi:hypothetical protein B0T25DRAFT_458526, partial [Lasiosphaeria hispida]
TLQPSTKSIHINNIIYLLHKASKPIIIRSYKNYFSIILISATPPKNIGAESERDRPEHMPSVSKDF